jgi:site-specific recombinase XerD
MNLRERIVDHISRTVSAGEAREANILLGLLIAAFANFLEATSAQLSCFLHGRYRATPSIARRLSTMRLIYATLLGWEMIGSNPVTDIERPSVVTNPTDFDIPSADVERLLATQEAYVKRLDGDRRQIAHNERVGLAALHMVASGALLAELERLAVRDLLIDAVIVGRGTPRERAIWLSDRALTAIVAAAHEARSLPPAPDEPLLIKARGTKLDTKTAWRALNDMIVRADGGGMNLTPAEIHRAAANALLERGYDWNSARYPSGYREMPRRYRVPSLDEMERALARCHPLESA